MISAKLYSTFFLLQKSAQLKMQSGLICCEQHWKSSFSLITVAACGKEQNEKEERGPKTSLNQLDLW